MSIALLERFPVDGRVFETPNWNWAARIMNDPEPGSSFSPYPDMVLFELEFRRMNPAASEVRRLRLWTSHAGLCNEGDYHLLLIDRVHKWLSMSRDTSGEIWCLRE
jgi:hypothetical protein